LRVEAAEPTEQMGIAAQIGQTAQLWEIGLEIAQEAMDGGAIVPVSSRESPNAGLKQLLEFAV